jgi:hypothetical protein
VRFARQREDRFKEIEQLTAVAVAETQASGLRRAFRRHDGLELRRPCVEPERLRAKFVAIESVDLRANAVGHRVRDGRSAQHRGGRNGSGDVCGERRRRGDLLEKSGDHRRFSGERRRAARRGEFHRRHQPIVELFGFEREHRGRDE